MNYRKDNAVAVQAISSRQQEGLFIVKPLNIFFAACYFRLDGVQPHQEIKDDEPITNVSRFVPEVAMQSGRVDMILVWLRGPNILDIGCAAHEIRYNDPTWLHGRIRDLFPTVQGIDISEENVDILKRGGHTNIELGDAQSFSLSKKFNTVVAGEVIEHLENPRGFLDCCASHLEPGGRLILTTPYVFSLASVLYAFVKFPKTCSNTQHVAWYCPTTLRELATRSGFEVENWDLLADYYPHLGSAKYRIFYRLLYAFSRILPKRLYCNAMLFVLTLKAGEDAPRKTSTRNPGAVDQPES